MTFTAHEIVGLRSPMLLGQTPFIAWHVEEHTAWIDLLFVPRESRRHGQGRAMVDRVLRALPEEVNEVEVLAAEIDSDSPTGFWEKLGFEPEDDFGGGLCARYLRKPLLATATLRTVDSACGRSKTSPSPDTP